MIIIWGYDNQRQDQWTAFVAGQVAEDTSAGDGGITVVSTRRHNNLPAILNRLKRRPPRTK